MKTKDPSRDYSGRPMRFCSFCRSIINQQSKLTEEDWNSFLACRCLGGEHE